MTTPLRDALTQRINQVGPANPDLEELVGLGEQRLRRRRMAAVAGTGAAVALAIALAIGGTAWNRSAENSGPIDRPPKHPHQTQTITRPIVYSDDVEDFHVGTLHVGDHLVSIDQELRTRGGWDLAQTDAGVVYGKSDGLWFTDGGTPRRIAVCGGKPSGSSDTWATWIDCAGELVVFDTATGEEVARKPLPQCLDEGWSCEAEDLVGEHAYFTRTGGASGLRERRYRYDVSTSRVVAATDRMYAHDLRSHLHGHGLVFGDSWRTSTPLMQVRFEVVGSGLVPTPWDSGPTKAFDAATGKRVRLRLPDGTTPVLQDPVAGWEGYIVFAGLDDDTIALIQGYEQRPVGGDIITCHLSDGRCHIAVPAGPPDRIRLVPGASYPQ